MKLTGTPKNLDKVADEVFKTRRAIKRLGDVVRRQSEKIVEIQRRINHAKEAARGYAKLAKECAALAAELEIEVIINGGDDERQDRNDGATEAVSSERDSRSQGREHQGFGGFGNEENGRGNQRVNVRGSESGAASEGFGAGSASIRQAPPQRFLRASEVVERYGISRANMYRMVKEGKFPQPCQLGTGTSRWDLKDLAEWENGITRKLHGPIKARKA